MAASSLDDPRLDPQMRAAMLKMGEIAAEQGLGKQPIGMPPDKARDEMEKARAWWNEDLPDMARAVETTVPGPSRDVPVRILYPIDAPNLPVIVYYHGGGWVSGSLNTHHRAMRILALASGCAVFAVNYAKAPETKFPAPLEECIHVAKWVQENGEQFGFNCEKLALGGDSAGGNLALSTAIALRDEGMSAIKALLLFYGVFDSNFETGSYQEFADGRFGLARAGMIEYWEHYVRNAEDMKDPRASNIKADLAGLPITHVYAAELDVLRDDSVAFNEKLRAAGVDGTFTMAKGLIHAYINASRMVGPAVDHLNDAGAKIKSALG